MYRVFRLAEDTARVPYFLPYGGHGPAGGRGRRGRLYPLDAKEAQKEAQKKEPISFTIFSCFDASFDRRGHII